MKYTPATIDYLKKDLDNKLPLAETFTSAHRPATNPADLSELARQLRMNVVEMVSRAGSGHLGSALGVADLMALMYRLVLVRPVVDDSQRDFPDAQLMSDRFLLSAGHLTPVWYAVLAQNGYFDAQELEKFRQFGSPLQGHPQRKLDWGIENSSGPLGQGVSQAAGLALGLKRRAMAQNWPRVPHVYVLSSDGEQEEGQVWEAYQFAAHYNLDNLTLIIDVNKLQISGPTDKIMNQRRLDEKLLAFGWKIFEADGHNFRDLAQNFVEIKKVTGQPQALIMHTILGKGVSFMENNPAYHAGHLNEKLTKRALDELEIATSEGDEL